MIARDRCEKNIIFRIRFRLYFLLALLLPFEGPMVVVKADLQIGGDGD